METLKKDKFQNGRKGQNGRKSKYDPPFQRKVALQYLQGNQSMNQVAQEYGISNFFVHQWSKQYSLELAEETIIVPPMSEEEKNELESLKKHNDALKKMLEYEQMKNFALETMINLAKEQLGVDLRKNSGAK